TDQAIHSHIGMKKSTFSSIKTRLKESHYYHRFFIPNFPVLDFELLFIMFGELNRFTTFDERMRVAGDMVKSFTEDFYVVSEANHSFSLSVSQNYTEYAKNQMEFMQVYSENKFLSKDGMTHVAFPFEISQMLSFLDYESLLARLFGFSSEPYETRKSIPFGRIKRIKLTKAEKKVLAGLIKYPDETDTLIADEVGVSRNTVANAKRKFLKKKICFPRVVPDIERLGLKTLVFNYTKYRPKLAPEDRAETSEKIRMLLSPHFYIYKNLDGFIISAHESKESFDEVYTQLYSFYRNKDYILGDPINYYMNIPDMKLIKSINYLPMILKMLKFDPKIPIKDQ
ncbi:MAG: hypothetical protein OEZ01_01780, partial [Candidatus Heimdallarchaeota archaeon]|nr:hypothetical protein [Candidatus Heimdallarchaeota archaeon]